MATRCVPTSVLVSLIAVTIATAAATGARAEPAADGAEWYFVGGGSSTADGIGSQGHGLRGAGAAGTSAQALAGLGPERYEFVLVLSDTADPGRIGLSSGQSLAITVPRDTYTFLVNRAVELDLGTAITPHFMAGLGLTYQLPPEPGGVGLAAEDWQPAIQFGVGASYDLTEQFAITARLRAFYLGGEATEDSGVTTGKFSQDFFVGARVRF